MILFLNSRIAFKNDESHQYEYTNYVFISEISSKSVVQINAFSHHVIFPYPIAIYVYTQSLVNKSNYLPDHNIALSKEDCIGSIHITYAIWLAVGFFSSLSQKHSGNKMQCNQMISADKILENIYRKVRCGFYVFVSLVLFFYLTRVGIV